jgi:hypothetical protein
MKQILHIFTKDVRRFWPEILTLLALVAAFIVIHSYIWAVSARYSIVTSSGGTLGVLMTLYGSLVVLIPVGWWLLITRTVHEERLVGDTQFWITRPYQWKSLLASKLLFVVAFVYVPIFLAQCVLLAQEGFAPQPQIPGLLWNLLMITASVVLPLIALAAATSSAVGHRRGGHRHGLRNHKPDFQPLERPHLAGAGSRALRRGCFAAVRTAQDLALSRASDCLPGADLRCRFPRSRPMEDESHLSGCRGQCAGPVHP